MLEKLALVLITVGGIITLIALAVDKYEEIKEIGYQKRWANKIAIIALAHLIVGWFMSAVSIIFWISN